MQLILFICTVWLAATTSVLAESLTNVTIPFGEAAIWASNNKELKDCAGGKCEEETTHGVYQALKYTLNNARMAFKYTLTEDIMKYYDTISELTNNAAELESIDQERQGRKWQKKFKKLIKDTLKLFADKKFTKILKQSNVTLEIPNDDIGLIWRTQSVQLPIYSHEDAGKGLAELKFKMSNGIEIPRVGFGTWQTEGQECVDAVLAALKVGYRHIDTAQSYENEADVGKAIQEAIKQGVIKSREDIFLATKLSDPRDYGTKKSVARISEQLKLLQTPYLDLYMLHGPESLKKNRASWKGMTQQLKEGKIKSLGISNFESEEDVKGVARQMTHKPTYLQNKFSIYSPGGQSVEQGSMLQVAEKRGVAFVAYSVNNPWPFVLSPREDPHVVAIAKRYNRTPAQVLNRWALQLNALIIPKSKNAARIEENAGVVEFAINESDMRLLNGLTVLYQSTTEQRPSFTKDVYGLFTEEEGEEGEEEENERRPQDKRDEL